MSERVSPGDLREAVQVLAGKADARSVPQVHAAQMLRQLVSSPDLFQQVMRNAGEDIPSEVWSIDDLLTMSPDNVMELASRHERGEVDVDIIGVDRTTLREVWDGLEFDSDDLGLMINEGFTGVRDRSDILLVADIVQKNHADELVEAVKQSSPEP